jgi:hypothetical protein
MEERGRCFKHDLGLALLLCVFGLHKWEANGYWCNTPNGKEVRWVHNCVRCRAACEGKEQTDDLLEVGT